MLEWAEAEYPDSALFLYFKSRILRLQVLTELSLLLLLLWLFFVKLITFMDFASA